MEKFFKIMFLCICCFSLDGNYEGWSKRKFPYVFEIPQRNQIDSRHIYSIEWVVHYFSTMIDMPSQVHREREASVLILFE